ncbi:HAD domain-containing protein [Marinitenerispora sediminis]|uniref:Secreted protein n=1 Tax=Marinitenerispora sediminis TaxID=1931232 RepID=A0A368TF05_9ACTN|nr:hypothetical protein [Marinitenerispora sediminis]RCV56659.1 hypothetical protein DEF28_03000 [Marinitenerispora sediminis]RCV61651.1 hypothetical protein DEF23_01710 [Marinitenerispora sediminis]RCV62617.1 hypothetical protein DEF24_00080 [Marinitenerispora sediminis]
MEPPALLIDIDGVLNPFPGPQGSVPPGYRPHRVSPEGHRDILVWLNPRHGAWISATAAMGLVRPVWASSWMADADGCVGRRIGLSPQPYIDLGRPDITTPHPHGYLWKRDSVSTWAADRPLAWIDDDFTDADHAWAAQRTRAGTPTLLIQPDPRVGLRRGHIQAVRLWAVGLITEEGHATAPV